MSVDPALSAAYTPDSLAAMEMPVHLINLGQGSAVPAAIDAANFVDLIPNAQLHQVESGTHFSFLGLCKPIASTLLRVIGEDPICTEAGTRTRHDIHRELEGEIGDFLSGALRPADTEPDA